MPISKLNIPIPVRPQRLSECFPVFANLRLFTEAASFTTPWTAAKALDEEGH